MSGDSLTSGIGIVLSEHSTVSLSGRTVDHTCLAETAAADTATLDLQYHTVLCCFDKRNNRCFPDKKPLSHPVTICFCNRFRHIIINRFKGCNGSVLLIRYFIEGRHIDTRQSGLPHVRNSSRLHLPVLHFFIKIQQFIVRQFRLLPYKTDQRNLPKAPDCKYMDLRRSRSDRPQVRSTAMQSGSRTDPRSVRYWYNTSHTGS